MQYHILYIKDPKQKKNQLSAVVSAILNLHDLVQFKAWKHYKNADMTGLCLLLEIVVSNKNNCGIKKKLA